MTRGPSTGRLDRAEPLAIPARVSKGDAMRFRSFIASVVLSVLATSTVGCAVVCGPYMADETVIFPTREIVVAADFIPAGETIQLNMLSVREVPLDDSNAGAFMDPDEVAGSVAVISIIETQPITPNMLEPSTE